MSRSRETELQDNGGGGSLFPKVEGVQSAAGKPVLDALLSALAGVHINIPIIVAMTEDMWQDA
jgi:hypothetical protein